MKTTIYEIKNGRLTKVGRFKGNPGNKVITQLFENPEVQRVTVDIKGKIKRVLEFERYEKEIEIKWLKS